MMRRRSGTDDTGIQRLGRFALLTALLLVPTCSSTEEKIEQSIRTARSWEATARSTAKAVSQGTVPRLYGEQVHEAATESERQLARQSEWQRVSRGIRSRLEVAIQELASVLGKTSNSSPRP